MDGNKNVDAESEEDKKKREEEEANQNNKKDEAPLLPESGQKAGNAHVFTRAEIKTHAGDQEWYAANEAEINDQLKKGLIT